MALKKVEIIEGCIACGLCVDISPEVFQMDDLATVIEGVNYSDHEENVKEAAESCPVEVIKYE
ncbi:MAG: ferredoxin [Prolixibacteraceae bacterium]|nr:ferredoxin [Prolixibacteraceae bacterium]